MTGLSGSGKSTAITALEDEGFYCVDNMPVELLPKFLELPLKSISGISGLALVMDMRDKAFPARCEEVFDNLREKGFEFELVFLEADENVLQRRFSQTRRRHPISDGGSLIESIREEKKKLERLRKMAGRVIDTSNYNYHKLKSEMTVIARSGQMGSRLKINLMSFGFKYGIPSVADLVADVRFLQNPYFVEEMKLRTGLDEDVRRYVIENKPAREFLEKYLDLLGFLIPLYLNEGKSYLTIAIGCTGGRHRSVAITEAIYSHLQNTRPEAIIVTHRDIDL